MANEPLPTLQNAAPGGGTGSGQTPPRRGRVGFWIALGAAIFFFLCSVALFVLWLFTAAGAALLAGGAAPQEGFIKQTVVRGGRDQILLLEVEGFISSAPERGLLSASPGTAERIARQLDAAERDPRIKAVVLRVNSPGGAITPCDVAYRRIRSFREKGKPVVAYLGEVAASGGYYVACGADAIVAHPMSLTGSIGVIMPRVSIEGLLQKIGVRVDPIKSGQHKDIGASYRRMSPEERRILEGIIGELYEAFRSVVRDSLSRRGVEMTGETFDRLTDGAVFTGRKAFDAGLVDATGYLEDAYRRAEALAGISDATVVRYRRPLGLLGALAGARRSGGDPLAERAQRMLADPAPRFLYLWTAGEGVWLSSRAVIRPAGD